MLYPTVTFFVHLGMAPSIQPVSVEVEEAVVISYDKMKSAFKLRYEAFYSRYRTRSNGKLLLRMDYELARAAMLSRCFIPQV